MLSDHHHVGNDLKNALFQGKQVLPGFDDVVCGLISVNVAEWPCERNLTLDVVLAGVTPHFKVGRKRLGNFIKFRVVSWLLF